MKAYEEELQDQVDKGQTPDADGLDVKSYQEVFRVLRKDPGYELSPRFAETVVAAVLNKQQRKISRDYLWFGVGILFLLIAFVATVLFTGFRLDFGFLNAMADFKGLIIFGVLFILFLNWLDRRLVKERQAHS